MPIALESGYFMKQVTYTWHADGRDHVFELAYVRGTCGVPYPFGDHRPTEIRDFFIGTVPVTQAVWTHVMGAGANPSLHRTIATA